MPWVLDRESGDLSRDGSRQHLQELPFKVLDLLLANPGGVVTREQLIAHLWPKGVFDYDTGINTAVRKLRVALGDIADAPKYIETIPRRGYRFLAALRQFYELFGAGPVDILTMAELCASTETLRDALAIRRYDRALHVMETQYSIHSGTLEDAAQTAFIWGVPFAQLLRIKGDSVRAHSGGSSIVARSSSPTSKTLDINPWRRE